MHGQTISHYKIIEKLGQGGMGEVWLAEDTRLGHRVAIKLLLSQAADDRRARARFLREARAVAQIDHPNILPLNEFDEHEGSPYFVTPYMSGGSLRDELKKARGAELELEHVLRWAIQAADGLAAAHRSGIVHRDIKPDNLLLSENGDIRIADFGLAAISDMTRITQTGASMGTLRYMSPEQVHGKPAGKRSDLFSLGVTLYELLTGRPPFEAEGSAAVLHAIAYEAHRSAGELRSDIPRDLVILIDDLLQKDKDRRPGSAEAVANRLRSVSDSVGMQTQPAARLVSSSRANARSNRRARWAIGAVVVAIAFSGSWFLREGSRDTNDRQHGDLARGSSEIHFTVEPFDVQGAASIRSLGPGIVELVSSRLDSAGALRKFEPGTGGHEDLVVRGSIVEVASSLHVRASMHAGSGPPLVTATVEGTVADMHTMLDQLAIRLLLGCAKRISGLPFDLESIHTSSLPALREFLLGEWHINHNEFGVGAERMARALDADPAFGLAWLRFAASQMVLAESYDPAREALAHAQGLSSQLTENTRMHLSLVDAFANGDFKRTDELARALISADSKDVEAWFWLEGNQFLMGWKYGLRLNDAIPAQDQLDKLGRPMVLHRGWLNSWSNGIESPETRLRLVVDWARQSRKPLRLSWATTQAAFTESAPLLDSTLTVWRELDTNAFLRNFMGFEFVSTAPLAAQQVASLLTEDPRTDEAKAFGHVLVGNIKLQRGRWNDATSSYALARRHNPAIGLEYEALAAISPFIPVPEPELLRIRADLLDWDPELALPGADPIRWMRIHDGHHAHLRLYLLGMTAARLGYADEAHQYANELQQLPGSGPLMRLATDLARGVRARSMWEQKQSHEVLLELEALEFASDPDDFWYSPFYMLSQERFLKAEALRDLGRVDEAMKWYPYPFAWGMENIFLAPYHLRAAQAAEMAGDDGAALLHYDRLSEYWTDCEEGLIPVLTSAGSAARRLHDGQPDRSKGAGRG